MMRKIGRGAYLHGMGTVSALGEGDEALCAGLSNNVSPIGSATLLDASTFACGLAAEVPRLRPQPLLKRRKDLKLMNRDVRLGVTALGYALRDAGFEIPPTKPNEQLLEAGLYVVVGTESGDTSDVIPMLAHSSGDDAASISTGRLAAEGVKYVNPLASLKTLPNMVLAHMSIQFGIMGPNGAYSSTAPGAASAAYGALCALVSGDIDLALIAGADSEVDLPSFAAYSRMDMLNRAHVVGATRSRFIPGEGAAALLFSSSPPTSGPVVELLGASQRLSGGAFERHAEHTSYLSCARAALAQAGRSAGDIRWVQITDCGLDEVVTAQLNAIDALVSMEHGSTELSPGCRESSVQAEVHRGRLESDGFSRTKATVLGFERLIGYCGCASHLLELALCIRAIQLEQHGALELSAFRVAEEPSTVLDGEWESRPDSERGPAAAERRENIPPQMNEGLLLSFGWGPVGSCSAIVVDIRAA